MLHSFSVRSRFPYRLTLAALLCAGAAGAATPHLAQAHRAAAITSAYMSTDDACDAAVAGTAGLPPAQTSFPTGQTSVCLVVLGSFQDSDSLTATIFDSQGRVAWNTGPGTVRSQFGNGASQDVGLVYPGLQYALAITSQWPDGQYRTAVNFNGPVVQSFTWAVGAVAPPDTPVPTPIIVGPTNTPIPTGTATPAPTSTSPPVASNTPRPTATSTPGPASTSIPSATPTPGTTTHGCAGSVPNVVRCTKRSVLLVAGQIKGDKYSIGSGFVVRSDATGTYLVTNLHVVYGTKNVVVDDPYSRHLYKALVVDTNKAKRGTAGDLAVVKIKPLNLPVLQWGNSDALTEGDTVISIGYPGRDVFNLYDTPTVTDGIVSALHRDEQDGYGSVWIQHQSIINHGNSGGPLLNLEGQVVGVNTLSVDQLPSATGSGSEPVQGIFYAIPSNLARTITNKLIGQIVTGKVPSAPAPPAPPPATPSTTVYKATGYQINLPGDWSIKKLKDGTPIYVSPDQSINIIPTVLQVKQAPSAGAEKGLIQSLATDFAKFLKGQASVSYKSAAIGPLSGTSGLVTVSGTKETLTVFVVGDDHHVLVVEVDALPSATTQETDQAARAVASIQLT